MRFGCFDDANREYVISTPRTPLPWINYLGCEDFFTLLSNTAGGYSFYRDARLRRLTRYRYNNCPLDSEGFRFYIKDGATVWNPGWQPTQTALDAYRCRHGLGYTVIEGEKDGVRASQELLVPIGDNCLLMRLRLTSDTQKHISLFPYIEFCLWDAMDDSSNFQRNYSTGEVEVTGRAIYHRTEYRERRDHYAVFWANREADGFDTARDAFLGVYGSPAKPEAVFGGGCTGSVAHGWQPIAAQQFELDLKPGEETSLIFGLGYVENPRDEKWAPDGSLNKTRAEQLIHGLIGIIKALAGYYRTVRVFRRHVDILKCLPDVLIGLIILGGIEQVDSFFVGITNDLRAFFKGEIELCVTNCKHAESDRRNKNICVSESVLFHDSPL